MEYAKHFAPHQDLATDLIPRAIGAAGDASHDVSHLLRVWRNVQLISAAEGGNDRILVAATLLHDCVDVPKDSPKRAFASRMAADKARAVLLGLDWTHGDIGRICHAVEAHSFSAGIAPVSLEARILQDADRLDAIGHVGVARCFYVSGRLGRAIYDVSDPEATARQPDDLAYAIDHFQTKLLRLKGSFQTETGNLLAEKRHAVVQQFLDGFISEVSMG